MKKILAIVTLLFAVWGLSARAAEPATAKSLAGHYYLQGVREVGSELLLKADGSFEWFISYGSVDQFARGRWSVAQDQLELRSVGPEHAPVFRLFSEEEMRVRHPAEAGTWVAIVGMPQVGPMPGAEVTFETKSGKRVTAVTDAYGDAVAEMPAGEVWLRAGLRRKDSQDALQWFRIPAVRAKQHLAAFAVNDAEFLRLPAFQQMHFQVRGKQLVVVSDDDFNRMVYLRQ